MYRILDRHTVGDYLRSIPSVVEVLGECRDLVVEEIGNGNLNFVYRVRCAQAPYTSVIVKQAVPYLRMVGESWPLDRERMTYEIRALRLYNELVPDRVPRIYHADEAMSVLVMQYLDDHVILRGALIEGQRFPRLAQHLGEFMAQTLFKTSALGMESQARRQLMQQFNLNSELCKLTEEFIFTFPYMEHHSNYVNPQTDAWAKTHLRQDADYKLGVLKFKDLFLTKADALLHADLHLGSLMVNASETYVIDMEFAYFGPFGFDIGKVLGNFFLCATAHLHRSSGDRAHVNWLLAQSIEVWNAFAQRFLQLWAQAVDSAMLTPGLLSADELQAYQQRFMSHMLSDAVGFAACTLARRTLGIAGVADIRDIADLEVRSRLEIINLQLSMLLISRHESMHNIEDLATLLREFYAEQPSIL